MNKFKEFLILYFLLNSILIFIKINAYIFTSLIDIEQLITTEKEIPKILTLYFKNVKTVKKTLPEFKILAKRFMKSKFQKVKNVDSIINNPIHVFHLIKRLTVDWTMLISLMNKKRLQKILTNYIVNETDLIFPTDEDLKGVCLSLSRLQQTYNLSNFQIAEGKILKRVKSIPFSADDCFEMGRQLFHNEQYTLSMSWLLEAMDRSKKEKVKSVSITFILEMIAEIYYKKGNMSKAKFYAEELLKVDPKDKEIIQIYNIFKKDIAKANSNFIPAKDRPEIISPDLWKKYAKLCNNKPQMSLFLESRLKCYYSSNNSPFLKLQPIKVEDAHLDPWIAIFYDIINDKDIELIKKIAIPMLRVAGIIKKEEEKTTDYRTGQSSWIEDTNSTIVAKLSQRLQEITGLDMKTAENLQVLNYGTGGYYTPHIDYHVDEEKLKECAERGVGNRIATVLIYLSDVKAGGNTVFPNLGIRVSPMKSSAVFWYNLLKTGTGNYDTLHASCPVLFGNKWVANKWIHEFQQEFRRPCGKTDIDLYDKLMA